jgi:O-antigen/teichoic acid export membrane protein
MFVISASAAIGYQADRIILSHTADAIEVARYSVAAQLFFPLLGIVSSAGYTLWGKYALERQDKGVSSRRFRQTVAAFAGAGLVEAALLIGVGPWVNRAVLGVDAPRGVYMAFGLLLALQSTGLPIGMLLTDRNGLKWQAGLFSIMVLVNVWLSIVWSSSIGAAGPVFASAVGYGCAVLAPSIILTRRYVSAVPATAGV